MRRPHLVGVLLVLTLGLSGCGATTASGPSASGTAADRPVLVYSGRSESLVKPVFTRLERELGVRIEVRYGDSSELAAQLLEEGDRTEADVFFSQDAGALGALAGAGRLQPLDAAVTQAVLPGFADAQGRWVATSARARVVAYHPGQAPEVASMSGIDAVLDPRYRGRVGYAPTNASFHSFVTALRVIRGEAGARDWLTRFKANEPKAFEKNAGILDAVDAGQISIGLVNHYYWQAKVAEKGLDQVTARIRFLHADDPGALVNVAGVGVLAGSAQRDHAVRLVAALLAPASQQYFADETAEYPVVAGTSTAKHRLPELSTLTPARIDLNRLDSLPATLAMLDDVGLT